MQTATTTERLLTPKEAADMLSIAPQTLAVWRSARRYDLRFVRIGSAIRYRMSDIEAFIADRTVGGDQ